MAENDSQPTSEPKPQADVTKLQQQRDHWMAQATDYERKYKGIDPEAARAAMEELKILREEQAKNDPKKFDEWKDSVKKETEGIYSKRLNELESELGSTKGKLKELTVVDAVMREASGVFNDDALPIIRKLVREECDYDGEKVIVKGSDGNPLRSKLNPSKEMDVAEYVTTLAEQYPSLAKPQGSSGGKAPGAKSPSTPASSGNVTLEQYKKMTNEERRARLTPQQRSSFSQAVLSGK